MHKLFAFHKMLWSPKCPSAASWQLLAVAVLPVNHSQHL